jgi:hypothetical protein
MNADEVDGTVKVLAIGKIASFAEDTVPPAK